MSTRYGVLKGFVVVLVMLGCSLAAVAKTPPGMEKIKVGNTEYVVPAGTKVIKDDGRTSLETSIAYTARRFFELDQRLDEVEQRLDEIEDAIDNLSEANSQMRDEMEHLEVIFYRLLNKMD